MKVEKFVEGQQYRVKKDFVIDLDSIKYEAKKGELLRFVGRGTLYAHFEGADRRLILLSKKEAFKFLEEK